MSRELRGDMVTCGDLRLLALPLPGGVTALLVTGAVADLQRRHEQ